MQDKNQKESTSTGSEMREAELDEVSGGTSEKDKISDMSQTQQMQMQMVMDRMTKANSTASQVAKKISDTSSTITSNLK